jgi:hypothetical protein
MNFSQPDVQFQSILLELADPNIDAPTKGHYLIKISKMLRKRELDFFAELPNPFDQLFSALIGIISEALISS